LTSVPFARAASVPDELKEVGITEKLGAKVELDALRFRDESGQEVPLARYFNQGRPVLLNFGYFECPMLCGLVLNGMLKSLKDFAWTPGNEFEVLTLSIDPREKPALAREKKANYLESYGRPAPGWHFLTGEEKAIRSLAGQVGWGYRWDEKEKQYAHGAALVVLTPDGRVSRYLYGIEYARKDLRLALLEASNGKVGTIIDRLVLFCYSYNPVTRKYSMVLTKVMQAGSAGTVVVFGAYLTVFWRRQRKKMV
jgi:protein SCO1/2